MVGRLVYYPSRVPFRAFFDEVETKSASASTLYYDPELYQREEGLRPVPIHRLGQDGLAVAYAKQLNKLPWEHKLFHTLTAGHIAKDEAGRFWYVGDEMIPLSNADLPCLVQGSDIQYAFVLWNGLSGELLSVQTKWGLLTC